MPCDYYFEWVTDAVCKTSPTANEIKCYVHDDNGKKRDLTPLIKQSGAYNVQSENGDRVLINVCRDITPGA